MSTAPSDVQYFDQILHYLQQTRAFDFTAYKRSSLMRRVLRRMQQVNAATFEAYYDHVQIHQDEFAALFNTILINVTSFFRDRPVWDYLSTAILPPLLDDDARPLRLWSAGTASGQEAYGLLMLVAERIGIPATRDRVEVYATDVDEDALAEARAALYPARAVEDVPKPLVDKYFEYSAGSYAFNRDLRRNVIFGRHDLVQDAPISRIDLLMCRNTLMYFNSDAQARILARFYFSLNPGACLVLGRSEMLLSHSAMFIPVDLKRRVFRAVPKPTHRDRLLLLAQTGRDVMQNEPPQDGRLREASFELDPEPILIIDESLTLGAPNALARDRLGLSANDIGRSLSELPMGFRPALELRPAVERALSHLEETVLADVTHSSDGTVRVLEPRVTPLLDDRRLIGARICFRDVTELRQLHADLEKSKQEVDTAYEELQSTNEELETTNEELQSTVEELETTNEELQSTNEELETMNAELQSMNEELHTVNDELRTRNTGAPPSNAFVNAVLGSLQQAVAILDGDLRVQTWNDRAAELWGLRPEQAKGANLLKLNVGLPFVDLQGPIREVLTGVRPFDERVVTAVDGEGRTFRCRVGIGPLRQFEHGADGVILLMEEDRIARS